MNLSATPPLPTAAAVAIMPVEDERRWDSVLKKAPRGEYGYSLGSMPLENLGSSISFTFDLDLALRRPEVEGIFPVD